MKLDCFFTYDDQESCGACNALFRPCNLKYEQTRPAGIIDTLHPVLEDQCIEQGQQTGIVTMRSTSNVGHRRISDDDSRLPGRKTGIRFSRANIKILKDWMTEHRDHPYPTEEEKEQLCQRTGLKAVQISNWLANTRRRTKLSVVRSRSPSMPTPIGSNAIDIRPNKQGLTHRSKEWENMNPLDRWKISPPENEPARVEDIANAVKTTHFTPPEATVLEANPRAPRSRGGLDSSANSDSLSLWQARSTANSQETSLMSSGSFSNLSLGSGLSHGSSRNSFGSFGSKVTKERRRRRRTAANPSKRATDDAKRMFQCTFCTDTFKSKYDWSRHEKSLHLSLEKWICSPIGEVVTDPETGIRKCVFCDTQNPDADHLETHNYRACEEKGLVNRTYYRKDHLRQHLRLMHGCKLTPAMEAWKSEATYIRCRCGFCGAEFTRWSDRVDHLAKHFRNGASMKDWKGCRGLEPSVAAQVTNAMPPYLIANEAKSPFPFSATNESSIRHHHQYLGVGKDLEATIPTSFLQQSEGYNYDDMFMQQAAGGSTPSLSIGDSLQTPRSGSMNPSYPMQSVALRQDGRTTCWEILTVRLGRFVANHTRQNPDSPLTDEILQKEARHILYDDDDPWNQTAADNPEWLSLFKQAHGISTEPNKTPEDNAFNVSFAEDLGIGDLTFDHFFEQDDLGLGDLAMTTGIDASIPAFTAPGVSTHGQDIAEFAAASMGLDFSQLDKEILSSKEIQMMKPAVDMMDLGCLYDCSTHNADPLAQLPPGTIEPSMTTAAESHLPLASETEVSMEKRLSRLMGH